MSFERPHLTAHILRIKGSADSARLCAATGLSRTEVTAALSSLQRHGLARRAQAHTGEQVAWVLTDTGHHWHEQQLAAHRSAHLVAVLSEAYDRFLPVNHAVKQLCSRWQMLRSAGAGGDCGVVLTEQLVEIHRQAMKALLQAAAVAPRMRTYAVRLQRAVDQVRAGDYQYISGVAIDSYHSVWFECHEDFLLTLGRDRVGTETG